MRVLVVSTNEVSPWGGSEEYWYLASLYLKNAGHQVTAFKKDWGIKNHGKIELLKNAGINYIYFEALDKEHFVNFFNKKKYDLTIIIKGNQLEGVRWMRTFSNYKIPYVTVFQLVTDLQAFGDQQWADLKSYHELALRNYFVSNYNLELFKNLFLYKADNLSLTTNPIDDTASDYVEYPSLEKPNIAIVSRLDRFHKGFDILFSTLKILEKRIDFNINIYGEGLNSEYIREMAIYNELKCIEFKGFVNDKRIIWKENHSLLMLSRMEGLPLSMLEALSVGRCIIGNKQSAIDDLLSINKNIGYKIYRTEETEIADELEEVIKDFKNWKTKGLIAQDLFKTLNCNQRIESDVLEMVKLV